jgi:RNA polymerase sigma-70 factor (ECF subfamily)
LRIVRPARRASSRAKINAAHRGNTPTPPPEPKCYTVSHFASRGQPLPFHDFDQSYVQRLVQGDFRTQEHFSNYFGDLLQMKLRSRLRSPQDVEDVRQETLTRVLTALRDGKLRLPDRLGPYVFGFCQRVMQEDVRPKDREVPMQEGEDQDFPDPRVNIFNIIAAKQTKERVRYVLDQMPERDRRLILEVLFEGRDKDEVCRDFGVTRANLRVLLCRAKKSFKSLYSKDDQDRKRPDQKQ